MIQSFLFFAALSGLDTKQIQSGLDAATRAGVVYELPAGVHVSGTLRLGSGAHLRFAPGAVLKMLPLNSDFAPMEKLGFEPFADQETSRFEHALLFASDRDKVTIEGPGRIECDRTGRGGPKPISLRNCKNVRLAGFTIDQAPNYAISLIGCSRVDIGNIKITRGLSDGIDLDATSDVVVHDVDVDSHDDAICLKASASLGRKIATRNVTVERCWLRTASVFFKLGTESHGDFVNIRARQLTLVGGAGNRHGNPGIALETMDGGRIRGVEVSDVTMENVGTPIFLRIGDRRSGPGEIEGVKLSRVRAKGARYASVIAGLSDAQIRKLTLEDVAVEPVGDVDFDARLAVREARAAYPEPIQFGPIPAAGFFFRHVVDLKLRALPYLKAPVSPAVVLDHVLGNWPKCRAVSDTRLACGDVFR